MARQNGILSKDLMTETITSLKLKVSYTSTGHKYLIIAEICLSSAWIAAISLTWMGPRTLPIPHARIAEIMSRPLLHFSDWTRSLRTAAQAPRICKDDLTSLTKSHWWDGIYGIGVECHLWNRSRMSLSVIMWQYFHDGEYLHYSTPFTPPYMLAPATKTDSNCPLRRT